MNDYEFTRDEIDEIVGWIERNFGKDGLDTRSELTVVAGTVEEMGELCRCVVKMAQGIRGTRDEWMAELRKEVVDVFVKILDICAWYEIDFLDALYDRWGEVSKRDWVSDRQGHGIR